MNIAAKRRRVVKAPEDRRQDLLDAAVRVFTEKGIRAATVADICEAAGVAKGTFYLYFESRDHLLGALRERMVDETLQRAEAYYARVGQEDWWALVDSFCEAMIDLLYSQKDIIMAVTSEGLTPETAEVFAECDRRLDAVVADGIRAGVEVGVFQVADPDATAAIINRGVEGAVLGSILYDSGLTLDQIVAAAKELSRKILSP